MGVETLTYTGTYLFGPGAIEKVGELCKLLELKGNAVMVNDKVTWEIAGKRVSEVLKANGFDEVETTIVTEGATMLEVEKVREKARRLKPSVVFGIGGGVNMDVAKAVHFMDKIPCITIPTQAATDAMTTHHSILYQKGMPSNMPHGTPPLACVVDMDIVLKAPHRFAAAGMADYLAKESAVVDCKVAHEAGKFPAYNEYAVALAKTNLELLKKYAKSIGKNDEKGIEILMRAQMHDGILEALGDSRILGGSEHMIGFLLQGTASGKKIMHGEACVPGTIMMVCHQGGDWKSVKKALEEAGCPTTAEQLGLTDQEIIKALVSASAASKAFSYSILTQKPLTEETATDLAKKTGII